MSCGNLVMPLGPQCWGCRWRRVRCDSQQPQCSSCIQRQLTCPGYSETKPLRWRHRVIREDGPAQSLPTDHPRASVQHDIAPPDVIVDALRYYNALIAPDLAADGASNFYIIDISKWAVTNTSKRHLTLCLVFLHRAVQRYGDVTQDQALFHYHQACAAEILNHKIQTLGQVGPDPELFEDVSLFFFSQIQSSAYGAWRAHLSAAKTLFNLWGVESLMGNMDYEFFLCHLVLSDVFGTAMAPASTILADDVTQHKIYLGLLGRFNVDVCSTMVPIPDEIARATAAINISRGERSKLSTDSAERQICTASVSSIWTVIHAFSPEHWASRRSGSTIEQTTSWALLATCFHSAVALYFARTLGTGMSSTESDWVGDERDVDYNQLVQAIQELYNLKSQGGVHYKYILWPMVVSGVEAVDRSDKRQLRFLCERLQQTTIDLGTLSMREASVFLEELWSKRGRSDAESPGSTTKVDWDAVFECAPLFLM